MSLEQIDWTVQRVAEGHDAPADTDFARWIAAVDTRLPLAGELTLRLVDREESQSLNAQWRGKDKPTNVLSFGYGDVPELLGDLVFCGPVVAEEAMAQADAAMYARKQAQKAEARRKQA